MSTGSLRLTATVLLSLLAPVSVGLAHLRAEAATSISETTLSKDQVWKAARGPYVISGTVVVPAGRTLTVEKGAVLQFRNGNLVVRGGIDFMGESDQPVTVEMDGSSRGIAVEGGRAYLNQVSISGGTIALDAYQKSELVISDSLFNSDSSSSYVVVRDGSTASFEKSRFTSSDLYGYMVQAYDSFASFEGNTFIGQAASAEADESAKGKIGIALYSGYGASNPDLAGNMYDISGSQFSGLKHGIESFGNIHLSVRESSFNRNVGSGLLMHGNAKVSVTENEFINNRVGIESYGASSTISGNAFETNAESSLVAYGGTVYAAGNWWNSSDGPYHPIINAPGTGEVVDSEPWVKLYPWIFEKPKKIVCCSSIYFLPGLQGSRLYRRSFGIENQLWEPNRNADVQKLFFGKSGSPEYSGVYSRDIIQRTNVTNGMYEKDIYEGLITELDDYVREKRIRGWKFHAYDWRFSPKQVVDAGKHIMLEDLRALAKSSKTGKVMVVAHSYGGLVFKELSRILEQEGLVHLVDKVVFVGVPEHGAPKALVSALHGEGQEIGMGLILNKKTARQFSMSIPATFALMPDAVELASLPGPVIRMPGMDVSTAATLESFLLRDGQYSSVGSVKSDGDTDIPSKAEERQLDFYRNENVGAQGLFESTSGASSTWRVASIVGTGLPTVAGIRYDSECDTLLSRIREFVSFKGTAQPCSFLRKPIISMKGDGVVLEGNLDARSGKKFLFDISRYSLVHERQVSHADMVSSSPVLSAILSILKDDPDKRVAIGFISEHDPAEVAEASTSTPLQWITVSGDVYVSNGKRFVIGQDGIPGTSTVMSDVLSEVRIGDSAFIRNTIPNMQYLDFGNEKHFLSPIQPVRIDAQSESLQAIQVHVSYQNSSFESGGYSYPPIIVTPDSIVSVISMGLPDANPGTMTGNGPVPAVIVDIEGDGLPDETVAPEGITGTATTTADAITFEEAVERLKVRISESSLTEPYKSRYYRKAAALERKLVGRSAAVSPGSALAADRAKAEAYLKNNLRSLSGIFSELSAARKARYMGGMPLSDAMYLYKEFYIVLKAALESL